MTDGYRLMDHTADFGLEIFGSDPATLYEQAALALFDLIVDAKTLEGTRQRAMEISGDDRADLMVNWLRELLYCWNGDDQLISAVRIETIGDSRLTAMVTFDPYLPQRHEIRNEIKAVTYHQIKVARHEDGWMARVILDI